MDARSTASAHARATRVRNVRLSLGANLVGALITFLYFSFVDNLGTASEPRPGPAEIAYFTEMEGVIRKHGGLVLQFIGDEIEAVFGAPVAAPDHATMAVRAAMEMRERLAAWNEQRRAAGESAFRHGVGIHTGTVLAGNIGSPEPMSYLLVGDPVNLASRIQGLNKDVGSDILLSGSTRSRLRGDFPLVAVPARRVKGKSMEVEVWQLR
ncbi:MAG TPA: adenylate/guanylate cyclase domain-containing protein [Candidatus Binatia bacterium]|nr:adenylate/guanylate cyclase domain-containing protein [Candidatus Binatia bacterium]